MSSGKTDNLGLCIWSGGDLVLREDFNTDNEIIDKFLGEHSADMTLHITDEERTKWNTATQCGIYFGDGNEERTVELDCDFQPSGVLVFALSRPSAYVDFANSRQYHYQAWACDGAGQSGLTFDSESMSIVVAQDSQPSYGNDYVCLNESGASYCWLAFK